MTWRVLGILSLFLCLSGWGPAASYVYAEDLEDGDPFVDFDKDPDGLEYGKTIILLQEALMRGDIGDASRVVARLGAGTPVIILSRDEYRPWLYVKAYNTEGWLPVTTFTKTEMAVDRASKLRAFEKRQIEDYYLQNLARFDEFFVFFENDFRIGTTTLTNRRGEDLSRYYSWGFAGIGAGHTHLFRSHGLGLLEELLLEVHRESLTTNPSTQYSFTVGGRLRLMRGYDQDVAAGGFVGVLANISTYPIALKNAASASSVRFPVGVSFSTGLPYFDHAFWFGDLFLELGRYISVGVALRIALNFNPYRVEKSPAAPIIKR